MIKLNCSIAIIGNTLMQSKIKMIKIFLKLYKVSKLIMNICLQKNVCA